MTLLPRLSLAVAAAATVLLLPAAADAQSRRAVPRVVPSRPVNASVGVYYGPRIYPRYYARPYWYGGVYYGAPYFYGGWGAWGGWGPWYPGPYYAGYGWGGVYNVSAALRLQVTPRQAEVFVDGYYAGTVDDFDGAFQRLNVQPGEHHLQVYLPGHRPLQQKVYVQPGRTFVVRDALAPLAPGEPEPARPTANAVPGARRSAPPHVQVGGAAREPSVATPAGFGSVALRVQPGDAEIAIDGEPWEVSGANERLVVQLGEGVHNVEIRREGYRTYITDITVRPGRTTPLNVVLTPEQP